MDPRVSAPFIAIGLGGAPQAVPVNLELSHEELLPITVGMEAGFAAAFDAMFGTFEPCVAMARCSLCFDPISTGRLGN